jgi:hypothetical protein
VGGRGERKALEHCHITKQSINYAIFLIHKMYKDPSYIHTVKVKLSCYMLCRHLGEEKV